MNEIISILPSTLLGWIATVLTTAASVAYIYSKARKNDMDVLRQSNDDLRAAHDDNTNKINELQIQVNKLSEKIKVLETTNKTLEDLVKSALSDFFTKNPKLAFEVAKKIGGEKE